MRGKEKKKKLTKKLKKISGVQKGWEEGNNRRAGRDAKGLDRGP